MAGSLRCAYLINIELLLERPSLLKMPNRTLQKNCFCPTTMLSQDCLHCNSSRLELRLLLSRHASEVFKQTSQIFLPKRNSIFLRLLFLLRSSTFLYLLEIRFFSVDRENERERERGSEKARES